MFYCAGHQFTIVSCILLLEKTLHFMLIAWRHTISACAWAFFNNFLKYMSVNRGCSLIMKTLPVGPN